MTPILQRWRFFFWRAHVNNNATLMNRQYFTIHGYLFFSPPIIFVSFFAGFTSLPSRTTSPQQCFNHMRSCLKMQRNFDENLLPTRHNGTREAAPKSSLEVSFQFEKKKKYSVARLELALLNILKQTLLLMFGRESIYNLVCPSLCLSVCTCIRLILHSTYL